MSEIRQKRTSPSTPQLLKARIEKAHAEGKPIEMADDEVTGVIDIALQKVRVTADVGAQKMRELARAIDCVDPTKGRPA